MEIPKDAIFRVLVQVRDGDKWEGEDYIYLNAHQAKQCLINLLTTGMFTLIAEILKPAMGSVIKCLMGISIPSGILDGD